MLYSYANFIANMPVLLCWITNQKDQQNPVEGSVFDFSFCFPNLIPSYYGVLLMSVKQTQQ